jgi:hypothetical protein
LDHHFLPLAFAASRFPIPPIMFLHRLDDLFPFFYIIRVPGLQPIAVHET